ncbi:MAG: AAA family ATPase [Gemmatimonadota bacterium]|nr:AAA family ATPase [Gemmatimonadota bacterium]
MPIIAQFEAELKRNSSPAFGRWFAVDLHNHSPNSPDFRGNSLTALDDAVAHLSMTPVDLVMFTDHGQLPERAFAEKVSSCSGKTILRGVELNIFVDAWAKPEGKIDKSMFFHLLVGFDPEGNQNPEYWLDHLYRECSHEERSINGTRVKGFTASTDSICDTLEESGAILIPAHLHTKRDPFKSRSIDDIYSDQEFLRLAQSRFTALEVKDVSTAEFFDGAHEETGNLLKTCLLSSDAHEVTAIGRRVTYVQMERPSFAELKAGLQMPFRVSLKKPQMPDSSVIGINIRGQFFSDLWLSFSPNCNALIGVKGSGKTSVLECLRFALGSPVPESRREEVESHLQNILGTSGVVRVLIKRKDGAKVLVTRSVSSLYHFNLTFEDDRQQEVGNPEALMFPSYILGWHEIEQAATEPKIRQVYLDTIAGREQIRQLREDAEAKASQIRFLHEQAANRYAQFRTLHDRVMRLEDLRAGLQELTDAKLVELRDSYQTAMRQRDAIADLTNKLRDSKDSIRERASGFMVSSDPSEFDGESPLAGFARKAAAAVTRQESHVGEFVVQHRERLEAIVEELEGYSSEIRKTFDEFTESYSRRIAELSPEQQRLLETHQKVMDDTKELPRLKGEEEREKAEVEKILNSLIEICDGVAEALDKQTHLRTEKVAELNSQLVSYNVNLQVAPLAQRGAFEDLAQRSTVGADILNQVNSFAPNEKRHHRRLAEAYKNLKENLIDGFALFFSSLEFWGYLGAFEEDDLRIGLKVNGGEEEYRAIDQLSAGQRCTAVFPLLLKLQEGPLIVDQPEDNLDNRHIAESIAPALLEDKRSRQIAFTSHNANLVVLADVEQIVMFEGRGSTGVIEARGFLCNSASVITPMVIAILDGGDTALKLRYQKYGVTERTD